MCIEPYISDIAKENVITVRNTTKRLAIAAVKFNIS